MNKRFEDITTLLAGMQHKNTKEYRGGSRDQQGCMLTGSLRKPGSILNDSKFNSKVN